MGRRLRRQIPIFMLIAALALVPACQEKEQLEKEAPALARADLEVDRIVVAGVVSDVAALGDSSDSRETWSSLIGNQLGRDKFGKLPIVTFRELRTILGPDDYATLLDRYKEDGFCDSVILADLGTELEGKARFIVFGRIQDDRVETSESEDTEKKTKTLTTKRWTEVRLHFYDLADQRLAWDHITYGQSTASKEYDTSDLIKHKPGDGFLGGIAKAIVNSAVKPEPKYPPTPEFEGALANSFDRVGDYLKPKKKK